MLEKLSLVRGLGLNPLSDELCISYTQMSFLMPLVGSWQKLCVKRQASCIVIEGDVRA